MITKNKAFIGLMVITSACICSFAFMQNESVNFAKAEDVIHTVTIDCDHNHLPETTGYHSLLNEVGTEINCKVMVTSNTLTFNYLNSYFSIRNPTDTDTSYQIICYVNGIVSVDLYLFTEEFEIYGLSASLYKGSTIYISQTWHNIRLKDDEGLCTMTIINMPVRAGYRLDVKSIVVKYSESKCRELSKQ